MTQINPWIQLKKIGLEAGRRVLDSKDRQFYSPFLFHRCIQYTQFIHAVHKLYAFHACNFIKSYDESVIDEIFQLLIPNLNYKSGLVIL